MNKMTFRELLRSMDCLLHEEDLVLIDAPDTIVENYRTISEKSSEYWVFMFALTNHKERIYGEKKTMYLIKKTTNKMLCSFIVPLRSEWCIYEKFLYGYYGDEGKIIQYDINVTSCDNIDRSNIINKFSKKTTNVPTGNGFDCLFVFAEKIFLFCHHLDTMFIHGVDPNTLETIYSTSIKTSDFRKNKYVSENDEEKIKFDYFVPSFNIAKYSSDGEENAESECVLLDITSVRQDDSEFNETVIILEYDRINYTTPKKYVNLLLSDSYSTTPMCNFNSNYVTLIEEINKDIVNIGVIRSNDEHVMRNDEWYIKYAQI